MQLESALPPALYTNDSRRNNNNNSKSKNKNLISKIVTSQRKINFKLKTPKEIASDYKNLFNNLKQ